MKITDLFESIDRDDNERDHWEAHRKTGFFGAQGAGCLFFALESKRFLVGQRSRSIGLVEQPGTFGTWGGAIDRGENPIAAIKREINEETGYQGTYRIRPMLVYSSGSFRYSNFLVIVPVEFSPQLNWEHDSFVWCAYGDWPQPMHFGLKALVADPNSVRLMTNLAKA